ncbi:peptidase M23 [Phytohabitans sp. ZYX-F-186]|uniref:Peptidase M23 n=1 Tax=Phytohabitans maris TaxID=3071409 RepID=A0ABU0ZR76_9ACTN|nr:peptidase M23 [Phytohabitans sp. ZYX-F-186]MDQ7909246.1 peptidase M23 [Phytohabitans sp. ZYX-F-186]
MPSVVEERARRWATDLPAWLRARDWSQVRGHLDTGKVRLTVATGIIGVLGFAAFAETGAASSGPVTTVSPVTAAQAEAQRAEAAGAPASRAERAEAGAKAAADQKKSTKDSAAAQKPAAQAPATTKAAPKAPAKLTPVAGLSQVQTENAAAIVRAGAKNGVPERGMIIAVATAMQESTLLNRASEVLPESKNYPHQGTGWDHDSVGLFQQRTSSGWGPVASLMQPEYAATKFYQGLLQVPGWDRMPLTYAAQAVQVSAFPEAYARHEGAATAVVRGLLQQGAANG